MATMGRVKLFEENQIADNHDHKRDGGEPVMSKITLS